MRKELILEDAGPQLEDWREVYVEKLTTQLPKALILPMEHTIKITLRGQRVWIAMSKKNSNGVRIVTGTRSALIPLAIVFFGIAALFCISLAVSYSSYMSMMSFYSSYSHYYTPPPAYYFFAPYIPFIIVFFGLGAGVLATNKTRAMQSLALQLARETWLSFSRRVEAKVFPRPVSRPTPPKTPISTPPNEQARTLGKYCMYCGTPVEKAGAKFCENCGKSLFL